MITKMFVENRLELEKYMRQVKYILYYCLGTCFSISTFFSCVDSTLLKGSVNDRFNDDSLLPKKNQKC